MKSITILEAQAESHGCALEKGWWDDFKEDGGISHRLVVASIPEKIALIHSEAGEALEDYRTGKLETVINPLGKPEGLPTELADIVIRVMDLAGALGIDLEAEVVNKMKFNRTRSHRHGGKRC